MLGAVVIVRVAVLDPSTAGVNEVGIMEQPGPGGETLQERFTVLLKLFSEETMMVDMADCPSLMDAGINKEDERAKSAGEA
jgi:hypothetical protein